MPSYSWPTQDEFYFFGFCIFEGFFLVDFLFYFVLLWPFFFFFGLVGLLLVHFDFCCFGVWLFENTKLVEWLGVVRI